MSLLLAQGGRNDDVFLDSFSNPCFAFPLVLFAVKSPSAVISDVTSLCVPVV